MDLKDPDLIEEDIFSVLAHTDIPSIRTAARDIDLLWNLYPLKIKIFLSLSFLAIILSDVRNKLTRLFFSLNILNAPLY